MSLVLLLCALSLGGMVVLLAFYGVYLTKAAETSVKRAGQLGLAVGFCCGASFAIATLLLAV